MLMIFGRRNRAPLGATAVLLGMLTASSAFAQDDVDRHDVYGNWLTKDGEAIFAIDDCGDGTPCGAMVWSNPDITTTTTDDKNPDPALRGRSLIGAQTIWGFDKGRRAWKDGNLYHAGRAVTYRARMYRKSADEIVVKGCVGPICIGQTWTRTVIPGDADQEGGNND